MKGEYKPLMNTVEIPKYYTNRYKDPLFFAKSKAASLTATCVGGAVGYPLSFQNFLFIFYFYYFINFRFILIYFRVGFV